VSARRPPSKGPKKSGAKGTPKAKGAVTAAAPAPASAPRAGRHADEHARHRARRASARRRTRRRGLLVGASVAVVVVLVVVIVVTTSGGGGGASYVAPPPVSGGTPTIERPAVVVPNRTGIPGVVAYDTTGWPGLSHNGPRAGALPHNHVPGPVVYSVTPPVGGDHNAVWMNCGVYPVAVPNERAVHNLEHGAVWITYQPSLPSAQVAALVDLVNRQTVVRGTHSRYVDLTPFPGLASPIVISAWGLQLRVHSPHDPRLQRFIRAFRVNPRYTPEFGAPCTGGVGTPQQT
jgi:hypothetical protein